MDFRTIAQHFLKHLISGGFWFGINIRFPEVEVRPY